MTTTIESGTVPAQGTAPAPAAPVPVPGRAVAAAAHPIAATTPPISATSGPRSADGLAGWLDEADDTATGTATEPEEGAPQGSSRLRWWLGAVFLIGGIALGVVGFYLSFGNLSTAAHERFGFDKGADSTLFAIGVDVTILICLVGDLLFATRGRSYWVLLPIAHLFTALTIVLNAIAHGSVVQHWDKALSHAFMPVIFVVLVGAGRHYLVTEAALRLGVGRDPIPWYRWALNPIDTYRAFRTMKRWGMAYSQVRRQRRELAIYEVWLAHREEIEAGLSKDDVGVLDRLPVLLAPHGVTVEQARALPARMLRAEQQRRQQAEREERELKAEADRHDRELKHAERMSATRAEAEALDAEGELAQLKARVAGAEKVAEAEAQGATAAAELKAQRTLAAVERAVTAEERRAADEAAAEESERAAEARLRAAEADRLAAEEAATAAELRDEEARKAAAEAAETQRVEALNLRAAQDRFAAAEADRLAAEQARAAAEERRLAAENTELAAAARARAAQNEALADMSMVQLKTRVVARLLLANPQIDGAEIAAALGGASPSTASTYRKSAEELIGRGYNPEAGFDPDISQQ
ncbi:DUF2637 domain-containing protein [Streptomyces erythrochromogenes]|uniref:DUF2637 domain-containing protein n=1 Tax=Streptomyces erythrochromogenes TaxID=285574 RepID=UPI0002FE911F